MKTIRFNHIIVIAILLIIGSTIAVDAKGPGGGGGGGGGETTPANNLSFPVIAADGFTITPLLAPSFTVPYNGPYTGLSAEELAIALGDTWYAQKVTGNKWQAGFASLAAVPVYGIDWGDNIESVNPVVGRPFRIEVVLFHQASTPMTAYTMALLANPSSPNEVQGTNSDTYQSSFATVVSSFPRLVIQKIDGFDAATLTWTGTKWVSGLQTPPVTTIGFGPELNVGGKYIFGASQGGWRPTQAGKYRITFYLPGSSISLATAIVGNYEDWIAPSAASAESDEGGAATPVVDPAKNLTYVDVTVTSSGGGGRRP